MKSLSAVALIGAVLLLSGACAGVTPSVAIGFHHTPDPTRSSKTDDGVTTASAHYWRLGGSLAARFPYEEPTTITPCASVVHEASTATTKREGAGYDISTYTNTIPGTVCLEFDLPMGP